MDVITLSLVASSAGLVGGAFGVALGTALVKLWERWHPDRREWPGDARRDS